MPWKGGLVTNCIEKFPFEVAHTHFIKHAFNKYLIIKYCFDFSCSHKHLNKLKQIEMV